MMSSLIEIENISYTHSDNNKLLSNISLSIEEGHITCFLGLNGSGKTTLLRLIMRHLHATEGKISYLLTPNFGYLPQKEYMPDGLKVVEYIMLGRLPAVPILKKPSKIDEQIVEEKILELRLNDLRDMHVRYISGGESQIMRIARALVQNPSVLVFDEPTSHLDIKNKQRVHEFIIAQKEKKKTILIATNDINEALLLSDKILLMRKNGENLFVENNGSITEDLLSYYLETPIRIVEINQKKYVLGN